MRPRRTISAGTCTRTERRHGRISCRECRIAEADDGATVQNNVAIVAGVDFGTLSVRVTIVDTQRGRLGSGVSEYPLHRRKDDPDFATQSHDDHMKALAGATRKAVADAKISGDQVAALAIDTTGSSVIPVDKNLQPLDEYYLWCDHRVRQRSGAHHRNGTSRQAGSDRLVRWNVFVGVGFFQAAALAAQQSRQTRKICDGTRALRHGCGCALRNHRSGESAAVDLRDGAQVDVEFRVGRIAVGEISERASIRCSAACATN